MKDGIHTKIDENWSQKYSFQGQNTRYRLWNKKNKVFCLKLVEKNKKYILEISKSLENVDLEVGVIFDIPEFPFDSQISLIYENNSWKYDKNMNNKKIEDEIKNIFSYESIDRLTKDMFKGIKK